MAHLNKLLFRKGLNDNELCWLHPYVVLTQRTWSVALTTVFGIFGTRMAAGVSEDRIPSPVSSTTIPRIPLGPHLHTFNHPHQFLINHLISCLYKHTPKRQSLSGFEQGKIILPVPHISQ